MLGWERRQENVTVFFFPPLFFLVLVISSFINRKYIVGFLFCGLKLSFIYISEKTFFSFHCVGN